VCIVARNENNGWPLLNLWENESVTVDRLEQENGQSTDSYTDHEQKMTIISLIQEKEEKKKKKSRF
jgi:hypothetical protein